MSGFAHPCPSCGCGPGECAICQSPNQAAASIFGTFTITGTTTNNPGCPPGTCETNLNDTFIIEMFRLEGHPSQCYASALEVVAVVCGFSNVTMFAYISQPNEGGEATVTIEHQNGDIGEFVASAVIVLPVDCESHGPVAMTIDSADATEPVDLCNVTAVAVDFSLSV